MAQRLEGGVNGVQRVLSAPVRSVRGVGSAIRARAGVFVGGAASVVLLNVFLPPLVLSLARKPLDYFTVNPWVTKLPEFVLSGEIPLSRKLEFIPGLALFWFSADNPYGVEWGFAVTVSDVLRFVVMAALVGAYFALWRERRALRAASGWRVRLERQGGIAGALVSAVGLSTGPCSVMGCGAPVIPVLGLAFAGLSSGTLTLLSEMSTVATAVVLGGMGLVVGYLGWTVERERRR